LKDLSVFNDLQIININFVTLPFVNLTKYVVWVLSAFTDWLGIEIVETNDVDFLIQLSFLFSSSADVQQIISKLPTTPDKPIYKPLYSALLNNNLYINEAALHRLAAWYHLLADQPELLQEVLHIAKYVYNII